MCKSNYFKDETSIFLEAPTFSSDFWTHAFRRNRAVFLGGNVGSQDGTFGCTRWHHGLCSEHLVAGGKQPNTCRRCGHLWWIFFRDMKRLFMASYGFMSFMLRRFSWLVFLLKVDISWYIDNIIMILMALLLSVPVVLMLVSNCRQFWALDWHSCNMVIDGDRNGTESTTAGLSLNTVTHSSNHWDVPRRHFWHLFFFPLGSLFFWKTKHGRESAAKIPHSLSQTKSFGRLHFGNAHTCKGKGVTIFQPLWKAQCVILERCGIKTGVVGFCLRL